MSRNKRARAATGSSEASVPEMKPTKRTRPRKSNPAPEDAMTGVEGSPHTPTPQEVVSDVEEKDSSDSDEDNIPFGALQSGRNDKMEEDVELPKPTAEVDSEGDTDSSADKGKSALDAMVEYVEKVALKKAAKKTAKSKPNSEDEAVEEKSIALPERKKDKGKGKAVTKPDLDDRTTGSSMHAPRPTDKVVPKTKARKPNASMSSRHASKQPYSVALTSPPRASTYAAKILARKGKAGPSLNEPEISDEQPWRRAGKFPNPVVHFDYQAPYRYMRNKPAEEILNDPNVIWAIPYGDFHCTADRLQTVLDVVLFLEAQMDSPQSIFETESGFYLLKTESEQAVKRLLAAKAALNYRGHRGVFFYECLRAPTTKAILVSNGHKQRILRDIGMKMPDSLSDLLVIELQRLRTFSNFTPEISIDAMTAGRYNELFRYIAKLDFSEGLDNPETEEKAIDAMWKWDARWSDPYNNSLTVVIGSDPTGTEFYFRLLPLCAFCHSDGHWKDSCRWRKEYPTLRDWEDKAERA